MQAHSEASKQPLQAYTAYDKPRDVDKLMARIIYVSLKGF